MALLSCGNGQIKRQSRFAHTALFCYNCDYIHVYTYKIRLIYEYKQDACECKSKGRHAFVETQRPRPND